VFDRFTTGCARFAGSIAMFGICLVLAALGVAAYFSANPQWLAGANLLISIVTLLLLPVLQATQDRDGAALQVKLDELIKSNSEARNALIGLEQRGTKEIEQMRAPPSEGE